MNGLMWWIARPIPWLPTASNGDLLWLVLSLVFGLAFTAWNLRDAYRTHRAVRADESGDPALLAMAHGHIQKAWLFAAIDAVCVLIGVWAVWNLPGLPAVVVLGLLAIRGLLSAVAYRDLRLRQRMVALGAH